MNEQFEKNLVSAYHEALKNNQKSFPVKLVVEDTPSEGDVISWFADKGIHIKIDTSWGKYDITLLN